MTAKPHPLHNTHTPAKATPTVPMTPPDVGKAVHTRSTHTSTLIHTYTHKTYTRTHTSTHIHTHSQTLNRLYNTTAHSLFQLQTVFLGPDTHTDGFFELEQLTEKKTFPNKSSVPVYTCIRVKSTFSFRIGVPFISEFTPLWLSLSDHRYYSSVTAKEAKITKLELTTKPSISHWPK